MKALFTLSTVGAFVAVGVAVVSAVLWIIAALRHKKTAAKRACVFAVVVLTVCVVSNGIAYFNNGAPEPSGKPAAAEPTEPDIETQTEGTEPLTESESQEPQTTPTPVQKEPSEQPEEAQNTVEPTEPSAPDYDAMIAKLEAEVNATMKSAVEGNFNQATEAEITFAYYTGFVLVRTQHTGNLTTNLVKEGIWRDIGKTLSAVTFDTQGFEMILEDGSTIPCYGIERVGFNITDPDGTIILKAEYTKEAIQGNDWSSLNADAIETLADWKDVSPAIQ